MDRRGRTDTGPQEAVPRCPTVQGGAAGREGGRGVVLSGYSAQGGVSWPRRDMAADEEVHGVPRKHRRGWGCGAQSRETMEGPAGNVLG